MCGSDEPHPYPERSSPTRLSTSEHESYKGRSCLVSRFNVMGYHRVKIVQYIYIYIYIYSNKAIFFFFCRRHSVAFIKLRHSKIVSGFSQTQQYVLIHILTTFDRKT